jgi:hypothetical protein
MSELGSRAAQALRDTQRQADECAQLAMREGARLLELSSRIQQTALELETAGTFAGTVAQPMNHATAVALTEAACEIIAQADYQQRDLSDFEAGRVDALLDVAEVMRTVERLQAA